MNGLGDGIRRKGVTCTFEFNGKVYKTTTQILKLLTYEKEKGNDRVASWMFAMYLAAGRIEATGQAHREG